MSHLVGVVAVVITLASRVGAATAPPVRVAAEVTFTAAVAVVVTAENTGTETLLQVTPEVRHRLLEQRGAPATLAPGERHAWNVTFPPPGGPGGTPLVVLLRWEDARGGRHSQPFARVVDTPGLLPTEAQMLVESEPASGHERAVVRLTNATATPLRGRLVALIPDEFFTTPEAQPVEVPPRQSLAVPIDVQSQGTAGTTYPLYAILQFEQGGMPRAIVATTRLGIGITPERATVRPLAVGTAGLLLAVGLLLVANQRAARRRAQRDAG